MSADEEPSWAMRTAPKQSITELLHNPRPSKLELPRVPSFDISAASLSLAPTTEAQLPEPYDINFFEPYLRKYAPLVERFESEIQRAAPTPQQLYSVPSEFFDPDFAPASSQHLLQLQQADTPLCDHPRLPELRAELTEYQTTLEHHLKLQLDRQETPISQAIANIRTLRQSILDTAAALRQTRNNAALLIPKVSSPVLAVERLTQVQANLNALKEALNHVQTVTNAPSDVAILLDSGEYSAAIDTVAHAKAALSHPHLSAFNALSPIRARLAHSVEQIDNALRQQFRLALADNNELTLNHVVSLVNRMARLPLLSRYFMHEIKDDLTRQLSNVTSLHAAAKAVKASASRAVLLANIIHNGQPPNQPSSSSSAPSEPTEAWKKQVMDAYTDVDDLIAGTVHRILGNSTVQDALSERVFIVIIPDNDLTPENCFDEFKAALRFGEEIRALKELADELDRTFGVERRRSALRAKISEKQIAFLSAFHKAHVDALTRTIRSDRWQEIRVNEATSRLLSAVVGPPTAGKPEGQDEDEEGEGNGPQPPPIPPGVIVIGDEAFRTVATGVRYVRSICAYSLLTEQSPTMRSEFGRRGNDFCRLFNSLVGEAILQAAALQWSALRSITARHLSLASRTIALAAAVATHVNQPLEKALSGAQAKIILPLVKRSEKDLRDHHGQLLAKILAIMMDRLDAHEKTLKSLPWSKQQEMERFEMPSVYAVTLAKEASVLHRILWSVLPRSEVFDIFQRVCAAYGTHLSEAYSVLDGTAEWIRARVANDVSCLHNRLRLLDVFKANPALFNPLSKLYARFAKEFFETGTKKVSTEKPEDKHKSQSPSQSQGVQHAVDTKTPVQANPDVGVDKEQSTQARKAIASDPTEGKGDESKERKANDNVREDRGVSGNATNGNVDSVTRPLTADILQSNVKQDGLESSPKEPSNDPREESSDDPCSSRDTSIPCSSQELSFSKSALEQNTSTKHVDLDGRADAAVKSIPDQMTEKQGHYLTGNTTSPTDTHTENCYEDRPGKENKNSSKVSVENAMEEKEGSASGSPESIKEIVKTNATQEPSAEEPYQTSPEHPEDVHVQSETPQSDECARVDVKSGELNGTTESRSTENSIPDAEET